MTFLRYDLGVQLCHRVGTDAASLEGVYYHGSVVASDKLLLCDFQLISHFSLVFIGFPLLHLLRFGAYLRHKTNQFTTLFAGLFCDVCTPSLRRRYCGVYYDHGALHAATARRSEKCLE